MSKINTNMAAVTALYHLKNKEDAQNQAIERISSGLRLNHALDDAAGASIVSRMTSQIKGLEAAMRNAADAISLTQTAEGALDEVSSILHRMRELSVQAANGVYTGQDRQAIQNEVGQIQIELARIAQNSTFNAVKMLNGDFTNTAFQIGFQPNDTAILSIENVDPTGLGEYLTKTDQLRNASATFMPAAAPIVANDKASFQPRIQETENLTIYGNVGNVTIDINGGSTAKEIAASISSRLSETGVSATAQTRLNVEFAETANGTQKTDTVSFNLYGKNTTTPTLIAANVTFGETNGRGADLTELAAAVNGATGKTGISASLSVDKATMTLLSDDGYDIVAENYSLVGVTGPNMIVAGADEKHAALAGVTKLNIQPGIEPNSVQVSGEVTFRSPFIFSVASGNIGTSAAPNLMSPLAPFESTSTAFDVTPGTYIVNTGTAKASSTYGGGSTPSPTASGTTGTGMTLQVTVEDVSSVATVTGVQILNPGKNYQFHNVVEINGSAFETGGTGSVQLVLNPPSTTGLSNDTAIVNSGGMFSSNPPGASLSSVSQLDVLTVANAKKMLTAVDGALVRIDLERSDLGATMSRMEHVINNLSNISKNTKEARSRIQDADIALETTNLTKAQVLNQAAQAMLAQANRTSQSILSLLQN
ncbi:flagellin [Alphaproteobacteria bacterium]|nr:flagellin [Alphaproteobacteria bacterium]MDB3897403.1 flagellin [Alphaproteobacteria bacterium]